MVQYIDTTLVPAPTPSGHPKIIVNSLQTSSMQEDFNVIDAVATFLYKSDYLAKFLDVETYRFVDVQRLNVYTRKVNLCIERRRRCITVGSLLPRPGSRHWSTDSRDSAGPARIASRLMTPLITLSCSPSGKKDPGSSLKFTRPSTLRKGKTTEPVYTISAGPLRMSSCLKESGRRVTIGPSFAPKLAMVRARRPVVTDVPVPWNLLVWDMWCSTPGMAFCSTSEGSTIEEDHPLHWCSIRYAYS